MSRNFRRQRKCYTCATPIKFHFQGGRYRPCNMDDTLHECPRLPARIASFSSIERSVKD